LSPASRRLGQRAYDTFKVSVVLRRVQIRKLQAAVPGKDAFQHLGHHVRLREPERFQKLPGSGEVRYRTPYRGNARHGRTWEIGGRVVLGVKRCHVAAIFEPDDRPGQRGAGLFTRARPPPQSGAAMEELVETPSPRI
jgi:hypothetical protein